MDEGKNKLYIRYPRKALCTLNYFVMDIQHKNLHTNMELKSDTSEYLFQNLSL